MEIFFKNASHCLVANSLYPVYLLLVGKNEALWIDSFIGEEGSLFKPIPSHSQLLRQETIPSTDHLD